MNIAITGGAGFLGLRLARSLLAANSLSINAGAATRIERIYLIDRAAPPVDVASDPRVQVVLGDLNALLAGTLLRPQLEAMKLLSHAQMQALGHGRLVRTCGLMTMRQQPQTAKGTVFVTLEDETGSTNVIVWKRLRESSEEQRQALLHARLLVVHGCWEHDITTGGQVRHLIAGYLRDVTPMLGSLLTTSRDFR
jgi:hypothetical protein